MEAQAAGKPSQLFIGNFSRAASPNRNITDAGNLLLCSKAAGSDDTHPSCLHSAKKKVRIKKESQKISLDEAVENAASSIFPMNSDIQKEAANSCSGSSSEFMEVVGIHRNVIEDSLSTANKSTAPEAASALPSTPQKDDKLWKKRDISHMRSLLEGKKGGRWKRIKELRALQNLEIATHLLEKLEQWQESIGDKTEEQMMEFILKLASLEPVKQGHQLLGILLYFLDKEGWKFLEKLDFSKFENCCLSLELFFKNEMVHILKILDDHIHRHKKSALQDPELCRQIKIPLTIAKILITQSGYVNYALIDRIIPYFVKDRCRPLNHAFTLLKGLKLLRKPHPLRIKFRNITKPHYERSLANSLIRIQLNYDSHAPVTDADAKKTVLAALLSHLRQGPKGSCFATHFAVVLLSSHLENCLDDFAMLLGQGKLTRKINLVKKDFPFLLRIGDQKLNNGYFITQDGELLNGSDEPSFLWEAPGIVAACRAIGIENTHEAVSSSIKKHFPKDAPKDSRLKIDIYDMLSSLSKYQSELLGLTPHANAKLSSLAIFAFEAEARNGLQSVWENSIAEMAEGKDEGMIKSPILHATCSPLKNYIEGIAKQKNIPGDLSSQILAVIRKSLLEQIHLHYDPQIINHSIDAEHHSSVGGYVIYDMNGDSIPINWVRIDDPSSYQNFVLRIIEGTKERLAPLVCDADKTIDKHSLIELMKNYVREGTFILDAMLAYYPSYRDTPELVENWNQCRYTPWRTLSGNVAQIVREVYMEDFEVRATQSLFPKSAEDLLKQLIDLVKSYPKKELKKLRDNPFLRIPLITPTHALSLMLGHPTLMQAAKSGLTSSEWIQKFVILPGKNLANSPIDAKTCKRLIRRIENKVVESHKKKEFLEALVKLPNNLSIRKYRLSLIKLILIIKQQKKLSDAETLLIDTELCLALSEEMQKKLKQTAVHFADTNWHEGIHDINLCIAINPCTGTAAILEIRDDGKKIRPVKQYWLLNQVWKYYSNADEVLPPITPAHYRKSRDCKKKSLR